MTDTITIARQFLERTQDKRRLEAQVKALNAEIKSLEAVLIPMFENAQIQRQGFVDGTVYLRYTMRAKARDGDQDALCVACKLDPATAALAKERINLNTLSAWLRERKADAEDAGETWECPKHLADAVEVRTDAAIVLLDAEKIA